MSVRDGGIADILTRVYTRRLCDVFETIFDIPYSLQRNYSLEGLHFPGIIAKMKLFHHWGTIPGTNASTIASREILEAATQYNEALSSARK